MNISLFYEEPKTLHLGMMANRAYYLPYQISARDRMKLLSSDDWKFHFYSNHFEVP